MRKGTKICSLLLAAAMMLCALSVSVSGKESKTETPKITGSFVQPWYYNGWSQSRIDAEFARMKTLGITTLIIDGLEDNEQTAKIITACRNNGVKLFLGMGMYGDWWSKQPYNDANRKIFVDFSKESAAETERLYNAIFKGANEDVFAGFYFSPEFWNIIELDDAATRDYYVESIRQGMAYNFEVINRLAPDKPLLFSPFGKDTDTETASRENFMDFYEKLLTRVGFRDGDIFCPQDSIGAKNIRIENMTLWMQAYSGMITKVRAAGKDIRFWMNCEDFDMPFWQNFANPDGDQQNADPAVTSADVRRFTTQLQIAAEYAENLISFADTHYYTPYNFNPGFDKSYAYYLEHGEVESTKPATIEKVHIVRQGVNVTLSWTPSSDEFGIGKYEIYRLNQETGFYEMIGRRACRDGLREASCTFTDLNIVGRNDYQIVAYDCTGNRSKSVHVRQETKDNGVDLFTAGGETGIIEVFDDLRYYKPIEGVSAEVLRPQPMLIDGQFIFSTDTALPGGTSGETSGTSGETGGTSSGTGSSALVSVSNTETGLTGHTGLTATVCALLAALCGGSALLFRKKATKEDEASV